jgi:hypothetical protein
MFMRHGFSAGFNSNRAQCSHSFFWFRGQSTISSVGT